jgi:ATP-dependent RNA helicase RhlE
MLNLGFRDEMTRIFDLLPLKRQNILFSATIDSTIDSINAILLRDPITIKIQEEEEAIGLIEQSAYAIDEASKGPLLRYLIKTEALQQVLVFTSAIRSADNLVAKLVKNGIAAAAFHGDKSQGSRTDSLTKFKSGKLRVLVATDLAGRGIDIPELPVVINYELPRSPKDYIHRIGRTGRAGNTGKAISLITPADEHHFRIIQKKTGQSVQLTEANTLELKGY